ncbi:MAG: BspA family leucine-rich repeat surface protein [Oscillospiraceae bacterium]|nr:BspA family leucine-rich repeat surface protein [Oscillospiraceae bacterium]
MKKLLSLILAIVLTMALFTSCARVDKALVSMYLDFGEKYLSDMEYEKAIVNFEKVIEVDPKNSRAYIGIAEAYEGLGDTDSAIETLEDALDVFWDDEYTQVDILEKLIEIDPTEAEWYLELAQIYINWGEEDRAIEILKQGVENASDKTELRKLLASFTGVSISGITASVSGNVLDNNMIRNFVYSTKSDITEIDFLDSTEDAPEDAWDFSLSGDGSVLGWLDGTHLYVAGDGGIKADEDARGMFRYSWIDENGEQHGCSSLIQINFNNCFDTSAVTDMAYMFDHCSSLTSLDLSCFNTSKVENMAAMFDSCSSLTYLDISSFDTSNVTSMDSMFGACSSLTSLDLSHFNTSNVIDMDYMFEFCSLLTSLDLTSFDTSKVLYMRDMFFYCESLESLDLSSFNTSRVTTMSNMFYCCESLKSLDLSNFNTRNVTSMYCMFYGCTSLETVDVSSFNTSEVTTMYRMFCRCSSLTELDLSNFNTSRADTSGMLDGTAWG